MALSHAEEPEHRLSPEEARAFLRVHAEREAARSRDDAPTVADLAEALRLSPEETASILLEARTRTATEPAARHRRSAPVVLATAALLLAIGVGLASVRTKPPANVPAPASAPTLAPFEDATTPAMVEPPPDGFAVEVETPRGNLQTDANPLAEPKDLRRLDDFDAANLRERIVRSALGLLVSGTPEEGLPGVRKLRFLVRVQGGGTTRLDVPIEPFAPPLRNDPEGQAAIRAALARLLEAAWPEVVRPAKG